MADEIRRVRTQAERDADGQAWRQTKARIEPFGLTGHDRDCALAMLNQARLDRHVDGISDIQVEHLLAIGYRAGEQVGWHRGFDHARRYPAPPRRRWWHRLTRRAL